MFSRANSSGWIEDQEDEKQQNPLGVEENNNTTNSTNNKNNNNKDEIEMGSSFSTLKTLFEEEDWFFDSNYNTTNTSTAAAASPAATTASAAATPSSSSSHFQNLFQEIKDIPFSSTNSSLISSSCSQSSLFNLDQSQLTPKPCFSPIFNVSSTTTTTTPFSTSFDMGFLHPFQSNQSTTSSVFMNRGDGSLGSKGQMGSPSQFQPTTLIPFPSLFNEGSVGNSLFSNKPKVLEPLNLSPPVGAQPTLFQKRAAASALRENSEKGENLGFKGKRPLEEENDQQDKKKENEALTIGGSGLNYDSDDNNANVDSFVIGPADGDPKGKKKGAPAKNLMAERRRRKKLNDRLYMLRSVVPKISKMDRASILADAIEYLKELLQKINDIQNELDTAASTLPPTNFHPLTPIPSTLASHVKEELFPSSFSSPKYQPARVEVRPREGGAVNVHMFCSNRQGLLLSTMKALDDFGLDIQQAVISCFDGFTLDIYRAQHWKEGMDILPETLKTILLNSAGGFHTVM